MLGGFIEGSDVTTRVHSYEYPWGVGYLCAVVTPSDLLDDLTSKSLFDSLGGMPGDEESPPVALARATIESHILHERTLDLPTDLSGVLASKAGAFVSLHRKDQLRGCIGTTGPTRPSLAEEIMANAVQAATRDPRFPPLDVSELADLEISVDVLHEPESVLGLDDLDPSRYGVIVTRDWRRGLLLPDLEGVDTATAQVEIAKRKASIAPEESVTIERFRVDRYR